MIKRIKNWYKNRQISRVDYQNTHGTELFDDTIELSEGEYLTESNQDMVIEKKSDEKDTLSFSNVNSQNDA